MLRQDLTSTDQTSPKQAPTTESIREDHDNAVINGGELPHASFVAAGVYVIMGCIHISCLIVHIPETFILASFGVLYISLGISDLRSHFRRS
jgi:hypothetical protein